MRPILPTGAARKAVLGTLIAALFHAWTAALAAAPGGAPLRVVVLSGTDVMLPASLAEDGAIRGTLSGAGLGPIEFQSEGLDAYRFNSADYESELVAFWLRKYRDHAPDLVFALSEHALGFLERHRETLWRETPVVFTSVDPDFFAGRTRPSWATGIYDYDDVAATVALARSLQPKARSLLLVGGAGDRDRAFLGKAARIIEGLRPAIPVVIRSGVPISEFSRQFGNLPRETILLYTSMFRDSAGNAMVPREAASALARAASVPVFGTHATYLGTGIVGGALFDYESEGRAAGEMGVRILRGEVPSAIPVLERSPPVLAVDARQLARFGIPESRVPEDYALRFRSPTFWELYRWRIVAVAAAFALETALLMVLLAERRSRRRAEEDARERRRELAHAARLATVGELAASISHEINQPLGAILANTEAAELLLESADERLEDLRQILLDIRRDDQRASAVVQRVRRLAGNREMEMKPLDLNAVADVVAQTLRHDARQHGASVEKDLARELPEVRGDEVALQQVLINLALNAMEAMDDSPIERRRLVIRSRATNGRVFIGVSDTGKGIASADRPSLFTSFFTTKPGGVGLGLAICRSIVEAHGGTIDASNRPEGGALFEFALPVWRVTTAVETAP